MADLDQIARTIYMAHWGHENLANNRTSPVWENASENVKEFVRVQARALRDAGLVQNSCKLEPSHADE